MAKRLPSQRTREELASLMVFGGSNVGIIGVLQGCGPTYCDDLASRKHLMFDAIDAVLC